MKKAFFPGSFNPFTVGHASIVERALAVFDIVYIAVGRNSQKSDSDHDGIVADIARWAARVDPERIKVVEYADELTFTAARRLGCDSIVRGVRSVKDFEYERDMADINLRLGDIDTVLFFALPDLAAVSSSVVRELASYGHDVSSFLP